MSELSISVFGFPAVQWAGQPISFATRKVQALLLYLAVESGSQSRETLATLLWPDYDMAASKASLRQTLALLKRSLDEWKGHIGTSIVHTTRTTLALDPTAMASFDLLILQSALAQLPKTSADLSVLHRAVQSYRGDFLAGFFLDDAPEFETWVSVQREQRHQQMHQVLAYLSEHYLVRKAFSEAREVARRWVAHDRWYEAAYRALMMAQWQAGDRSGALQTYDVCRQVLADELGIMPEDATEKVREQVRTTPVSETRGSVPIITAGASLSIGPLPTVLPLIGREAEVTQVMKAVLDAPGRLITVVGAPGVGKTHLADAVLEQVAPQFTDRVWRIDLSTISTADLVLETIAQSMGCSIPEHATALERLIGTLGLQRAVVLLDNMEQVLDATVALDTLLAHCPKLVVLVTSREPLRVRREHQVRLQPLAVPSVIAALPQVQASAAVQLFTQQLQKMQPNFVVTPENQALVVRICQQLDGLPLGLVLAASQGGMLPLEEMLSRLEQSLPLPSLPLRDVPARHRSLQAAIAASYVLLDATRQQVLRQLGVFAGSWTIETAQAVVAAERLEEPFLDILASLVGHNLLQRVEGSDPPRYGMLATIRAYARAALAECGEAEATQYRYARYMMALAEQAGPHIRTMEQRIWITQLEEEYDNLRGVLDWAVQVQDTDVALRLSAAMYDFWFICGYSAEALFWFEQVLKLPDGTTQARVKTLHTAGKITQSRGEFASSLEYYNEALKLADTPELQHDYTLIQHNLGLVFIENGNLKLAEELITTSLNIMREGDFAPWRIAIALNNIGLIAQYHEDYDRADAMYLESLTIARDAHDSWGIETALLNLGIVAVHRNRLSDALAYLSESFAMLHHLGPREDIIYHLERIAELSFRYAVADTSVLLLSVAQRFRLELTAPLNVVEIRQVEQLSEKLEVLLGKPRFEALWAQGQTISEREAYALAQKQLEHLHQLHFNEVGGNIS